MTLRSHTNVTNTIYDCACQLFDELWDERPIRLLGVRATKLVSKDTPVQLSIFDLPLSEKKESKSTRPITKRQKKMDEAVDEISKKSGVEAVTRGSILRKK
jgi:DNA polymerase-4